MTAWNERLPEPKGIEKKMVDALRKILDDDEFVFCNRVLIKTNDEREEVIEAIQEGTIVTPSDMALYARQIAKDRGGNPYYK